MTSTVMSLPNDLSRLFCVSLTSKAFLAITQSNKVSCTCLLGNERFLQGMRCYFRYADVKSDSYVSCLPSGVPDGTCLYRGFYDCLVYYREASKHGPSYKWTCNELVEALNWVNGKRNGICRSHLNVILFRDNVERARIPLLTIDEKEYLRAVSCLQMIEKTLLAPLT